MGPGLLYLHTRKIPSSCCLSRGLWSDNWNLYIVFSRIYSNALAFSEVHCSLVRVVVGIRWNRVFQISTKNLRLDPVTSSFHLIRWMNRNSTGAYLSSASHRFARHVVRLHRYCIPIRRTPPVIATPMKRRRWICGYLFSLTPPISLSQLQPTWTGTTTLTYTPIILTFSKYENIYIYIYLYQWGKEQCYNATRLSNT